MPDISSELANNRHNEEMAKRDHRHWELEYAAKFVAKWEGFLPTAYLDTIADPPVYTIGYGHSEYAAPPHVHKGDHWTTDKAMTVLTNDLKKTARALDDALNGHPITFRQRIALISAGYNLGTGIYDKLIPVVRRGDIRGVANRLLEYDHSGGIVIQGLLNRRRAERWLMLHNHIPPAHIRVKPTHPRKKAH